MGGASRARTKLLYVILDETRTLLAKRSSCFFITFTNKPNQMKRILFALLVLFSFGCNKEADCGCDSKKVEVVKTLFGIVVKTVDGFEILTDERGLLLPCSELAPEFKKEGQPVVVSGTLK